MRNYLLQKIKVCCRCYVAGCLPFGLDASRFCPTAEMAKAIQLLEKSVNIAILDVETPPKTGLRGILEWTTSRKAKKQKGSCGDDNFTKRPGYFERAVKAGVDAYRNTPKRRSIADLHASLAHCSRRTQGIFLNWWKWWWRTQSANRAEIAVLKKSLGACLIKKSQISFIYQMEPYMSLIFFRN